MTSQPDHRRDRTLRKDPGNAMIGGVCAGLGNYFDLDPTLIRALFLATTLAGGFGPLLYLFLWILLEDEKSAADGPPPITTGTAAEVVIPPPEPDELQDTLAATDGTPDEVDAESGEPTSES